MKGGDFAKFHASETDKRLGKPPAPEQPAKAEQPPTPEPPRQTSAKQQRVNDAARTAVDRATADLRAEVDKLRAELRAREQPQAPKQPEAAKPPTLAEYKRIASLPGAPTLNQVGEDGQPLYASLEEFNAAQTLFIYQHLSEQREAESQRTAFETAQKSQQDGRVQSLKDQIKTATEADKDFADKIAPDVAALHPEPWPGEEWGPEHAVAQELYDSPVAAKMMLHLSEHPEVLERLIAMPKSLEQLHPAMRTRAHRQHITKEFSRIEGSLQSSPAPAPQVPPTSIVSSAGAPPKTVSGPGTVTDPSRSALARGDFGAYHRAETERRMRQGRA